MDQYELKADIAELDDDNFIISITPDGGFPPRETKRVILTRSELIAVFKLIVTMASENTKPVDKG